MPASDLPPTHPPTLTCSPPSLPSPGLRDEPRHVITAEMAVLVLCPGYSDTERAGRFLPLWYLISFLGSTLARASGFKILLCYSRRFWKVLGRAAPGPTLAMPQGSEMSHSGCTEKWVPGRGRHTHHSPWSSPPPHRVPQMTQGHW